MRFMPMVDLTPQVRLMLARGALKLQPGQWVRGERGRGRYLRTDARSGVTYVSWVRPGDDFKDQASRFGRACRKGFVGRHAWRYDRVKAVRNRQARLWPDELSAAF
ncbi:hypothetical protein [Indioceanicola profundi]|uniref:hypothetical protein n=1 Tax=Indioceanicola profundi TaxID=2220096 RepID=UPI000E6AA896|nr:hypothetical protein [Indioceanicola profundi]